ncbi:MAG: hypothetical protein H0V53_10675 [Rubrobacter sp.]|nr:hypothetical protein [Rubrobacter sp.]
MSGSPPGKASRSAGEEYRAKTEHEASLLARRARGPRGPAPPGDPASGIVVVLHEARPALLDALGRSLESVGLPDAYVTASPADLLLAELLSCEPAALVAVGPEAARRVDGLGYPLVLSPFSEAPEGAWFPWTRGTSGLLLPSLAEALEDDEAKRAFWRAFLALRGLRP